MLLNSRLKKLSGERMQTAKLTPNGDLAWVLQSAAVNAELKHIIQYDARPSGRIYHVGGNIFRDWRAAVKAAVYGQ